jgi:hypothetical protein
MQCNANYAHSKAWNYASDVRWWACNMQCIRKAWDNMHPISDHGHAVQCNAFEIHGIIHPMSDHGHAVQCNAFKTHGILNPMSDHGHAMQ